MTLKWSEKKQAWLNPQTGQWVKAPPPAKEEPVIEKTIAPQTLTEAPSVERTLSHEEVEHHYGAVNTKILGHIGDEDIHMDDEE